MKLLFYLLDCIVKTFEKASIHRTFNEMLVKRKVLVVGRHADLLQKVLQLLQYNGYEAFGETTNEGAISAFQTHRMDAVIIGGGVDFSSRDFFHKEFPKINADVKIIDAHPQTVLADLKQAFGDFT